jgi:hypothetical protein
MVIDPVEALVAITGIGFVNGERVANVSEDEIERAAKIGEKIDAMCKSAVNGTLKHAVPPPINFDRTMKELSRKYAHDDHVQLNSKFPPGFRKLSMAYVAFLTSLRAEVFKMLPRHVSVDLTGPKIERAPAYQEAKFLSVLQAIDDPLQVIKGIGSGSITKKQAAAVQMVYPSLSERITTALISSAIAKGLPSWKLNQGMATWFGTTAIDPAMMQRLQESHFRFAAKKAEQEQVTGIEPKKKAPADEAVFDVKQ